ncbi:caspase family protein [Pararhizobium sp. PWRC1-1]|uniref:caspase family protein n=1 Tax=Pararhizobium sp. PWRC1-1 TaxID=2804566 RepID=UPI003CEB95A4
MNALALIVGIDVYPENTKMAKLQGAVADAADFADWALNPAGGNVAPENLFFWTYPPPVAPGPHLAAYMTAPTRWPYVGPDFSRAPQAMEIVRTVPWLADKSVAAEADRIYVFLAGHGGQTRADDVDEDPQNCFIAADFAVDMPAVGLVACDDLRRYLIKAGPAELILFFDCCRNAMPLKVGKPPCPYNRISPRGHHRRLGVGRAAQDACVAYETLPGAANAIRGAFSKLLVGGLREHRVDGRLTLRDLEEYVSAGINGLVSPKVQYPDFLEKPRPPAIILSVGPPLSATVSLNLNFVNIAEGTQFEIRDQFDALVQVGTVSAARQTYALPIGSYSIDTADGATLNVFHHLGPGETDVVI